MPFSKASRMCSISILPVQGEWMMRTLAGILHALGARQVRRRVGAVVAAEGDDLRFPLV